MTEKNRNGPPPGGIWKIARIVRENSTVCSVRLEHREGPDIDLWRPGQYVRIQRQTADGWSDAHPFTVTNLPGEGMLQLTIKNLGDFSSAIQRSAEGTPIRVSGPHGYFCREIEDCERTGLIAGGIGITPFLAVLRSFARYSVRKSVTLFWASKTLDDFFSLEELAGLCDAISLNVVLAIQNAGTVPPRLDPRLTVEHGLLGADLLDLHMSRENAEIFLCGSVNMQSYVESQLESLGVDPASIHKETFGGYMVRT